MRTENNCIGCLDSCKLANLSLMVDRSFVSRKPDVCRKVIDLFGADNLRVWQSHAKFAIFHGGKIDVLAMFLGKPESQHAG